MKKNKLILPIVVGILLIVGLTVLTIIGNKVNAEGVSCEVCNSTDLTWDLENEYIEESCIYHCNNCDRTIWYNSHEYNITNNGNGTITKTCSICQYSKTETGICCQSCNSTDTFFFVTCYGCEHDHDKACMYHCNNCDGDFYYNSAHNYVTGTSYHDNGDGTHSKSCTICGYTTTEAHFDYGGSGSATSGANGICDKCGATMSTGTTCTHTASGTWSYDEYDHWKTCTDTTCGKEVTGTRAEHTYTVIGDKDANNHVIHCSTCNEEDTFNHVWVNGKCSETICGYECLHPSYTDGKCSICGEEEPDMSCEHVWDCKSDSDYHTCTVEGCGETQAHTWGEYWYNDTHHNVQCSICEAYKYGEMQKHSLGDDGVCEECGYSCDHNSGADLEWTYVSEDGCVKKCSSCGFESGSVQSHVEEYRLHTNSQHKIICKNCEEVLRTESHTVPNGPTTVVAPTCTENGYEIYECADGCGYAERDTIYATGHTAKTTYEKNGTYHWKICDECGEPIAETIVAHSDTDSNGSCDTCGYAMSTTHTHTPKTTYEKDGTHHWKVCSDTTCNQIVVAKETHSDNDTNGSCDTCGYAMSTAHTHTAKTTYETDGTHHWKICSDTTCNAEITGTRGVHSDTDTNGSCDTCGYAMSTAHTHTAKTTYEKDGTHHWKICSDTTCNQMIGSKEAHSDSDNDGYCDACSYKVSNVSEETCQHTNKKVCKDKTHHWEVCEDCGEEIEGSRVAHTYTNGECTCGRKENIGECTHTNKEWKSNKDEHWQVCKDCGEEIEGTREKHANVDGKCKNCGLKDGSTSGSNLPNTGIGTTAVIGTVLAGFTLLGAVKMKKYKDI